MFLAEMCSFAPPGAALPVGSGGAEAGPAEAGEDGTGATDRGAVLPDGPMSIGDDAAEVDGGAYV